MEINKQENLIRTISVYGLSSNIVNVIIGSGIFVLPAIVAAGMGASGVFAFLFCGLLIALIMLCFAEVGSKITTTGGLYTYIETAFGNYAGFLSGNLYLVTVLLADAAVSNALVNILAAAFPMSEKFKGKLFEVMVLFGKVPMFFYIIHIYWIHLLAVLAVYLSGYDPKLMIIDKWIGFVTDLQGYGFLLGVVYLIWVFVVVSLYPVCKWYWHYKKNNRKYWWLSYL